MMIEEKIRIAIKQLLQDFYGQEVSLENIQINRTRKEFEGDFTLVVFPFTRLSKQSPDATATQLGEGLKAILPEVDAFNVVKGFLNIVLSTSFWSNYFYSVQNTDFCFFDNKKDKVLIEFSSPNTNKPLHLGHVRNNLLGCSVANILEANGYQVTRVNLVNDRGIHICKSMLAWQLSAKEETPQNTGIKGDKLVGNYYVAFDRLYKQEVADLVATGMEEDVAKKQAPVLLQAQEMLRKWEEGDEQVRALWSKMNAWVYQGFDQTYQQLGIAFDKVYYESETYLLGKEIIREGLEKNVFYQHSDGSVRIDLQSEGLDEKILLRSDGTSVYMTQDLGTAALRAEEFNPQKMIYVVGNEQNYHFDVLKLILNKKLNYPWASAIYHLSYGMVELPSGKMKSREGTVVDADDLMQNMINIAQENTEKLGKAEDFSSSQQQELYRTVGLGALKYFILKVDPKKNILFNPNESIDMNGNTAPFIQYTHARICSLERKAKLQGLDLTKKVVLNHFLKEEKELIQSIYEYPFLLQQAAEEMSPALVANYTYELVKAYNHFYQDTPIFKEPNIESMIFRLQLSVLTAKYIAHSMLLLGINVPEKM